MGNALKVGKLHFGHNLEHHSNVILILFDYFKNISYLFY